MIICPSRYHTDSFFAKYLRHLASIGDNLANICRKWWIKCLSKCNSLGKNSMIMWTSLYTRKYWSCNIWTIFFFCHNHSSTRSSKRLMCGCCDNITIWNWIFKGTSSDESGYMSYICHQYGTRLICNLTKSLPIKRTRVCWESCDDKFWFMLFRQLFDNIHIDKFCFWINTIWNNMEHLTRVIEWMSMGKMSSMIKIHTKNSISRLEKGKKYC